MSDEIRYNREEMEEAYEAGYARASWERDTWGVTEQPKFSAFMQKEHNDPPLDLQWMIDYQTEKGWSSIILNAPSKAKAAEFGMHFLKTTKKQPFGFSVRSLP